MILRFHDDVRRRSGEQVNSDPPERRFRHSLFDRLPGDRQFLDDVLTRFGLSPHPSLLLVLEGPTEMFVVPEVMKLLGIPTRRSVIDLYDAEGVTRDFGFLASYIVLPDLGDELRPGVARLSRPLTRFLVAMDPEDPLASSENREEKRKGWIDDIRRRLPREYRTEHVRSVIDRLVFLETWDEKGNSFEFAHFSDAEIARALLQAWPKELQAPSEAKLIARVLSVRESSSKKVENLWVSWPRPHPSKPDWVRRYLWPVLKRRILDQIDQEEVGNEIPVVRLVLNAWRLAYEYPRDGLAFERDPPLGTEDA